MPARHRDAHLYGYEGLTPISSPPLSPEESEEDIPLSPMVFKTNDVYERSRLSYVPPMPARSASTPPSPTHASPDTLSPVSPGVFSQPNLSSPSLSLQPLPAFPTAGALSLALRLKRPLPPLPRDAIAVQVDGTGSVSRHGPLSALSSSSRLSPSSSNDRDSDSISSFFSPGPFSASSTSSTTSLLRSTSSDADSISSGPKAAEALPAPCAPAPAPAPTPTPTPADPKPKVSPLAIPSRAHTTPLGLAPAISSRLTSPYISVTPASPLPPHFSFDPLPPRQRSSSSTSVQHAPIPASASSSLTHTHTHTPAKAKDAPPLARSASPSPAADRAPSRAASPAPSFAASQKSSSGSHSGSTSHSNSNSGAGAGSMIGGLLTLRRIRSGARLFGRRTLSASEPWEDLDDDATVVGLEPQGSVSLDDRMLRPAPARPDTPSTLGGGDGDGDGERSDGGGKRSMDTQSIGAHSLALSLGYEYGPGLGWGREREQGQGQGQQAGRTAGKRLEIVELVFTEQGEFWEPRELDDVIPKLRKLKVSGTAAKK